MNTDDIYLEDILNITSCTVPKEMFYLNFSIQPYAAATTVQFKCTMENSIPFIP
jgi:hypothetical protein